MHYLAFNAPCVGHKDESRAQNARRVVDIINLIQQVAAAMRPFAVSTAAQWRSHTSGVRGVRTPCQENT